VPMIVVLELPPAPAPPKPNDTAPTVLIDVMVGVELAVTLMSPLPPAVIVEPEVNAETVLPMLLSTTAAPTAKLTRPALSATETISAEMVDVSLAVTDTPPAERTSPELWMEAATVPVSVLLAVVTAAAADPPM